MAKEFRNANEDVRGYQSSVTITIGYSSVETSHTNGDRTPNSRLRPQKKKSADSEIMAIFSTVVIRHTTVHGKKRTLKSICRKFDDIHFSTILDVFF